MKFLLDTHILLYWLGDIEKLSRRQTEIIQTADAGKPLWVSDISLWEIATLHSLGRIQLQYPLRDWLEAAVAPPLVHRIGISPAVAAGVSALPDSFHRAIRAIASSWLRPKSSALPCLPMIAALLPRIWFQH